MLVKILKLFGIDLPAVVAEARVDIEEHFDLAKVSVVQTAQTAAVLTLLLLLAGAAALCAFGVALFALYRWVSAAYGEFYGFAAAGAILLSIAIVLFASAIGKLQSWPGESDSRVAEKRLELAQARAGRVAAATKAIEERALSPPPQSQGTGAASDLIDPLIWALSNTIELPAAGNPAIDALFAQLQSSARGVADETVEGLVHAVRYGDRPQLFAALGGAMFVGWFLGRSRPHKIDVVGAQ